MSAAESNLSAEEVFKWLDSHPEVLSKYLLENASCRVVDTWLAGAPANNNPASNTRRRSSGASSTAELNGRVLSPILSDSSVKNKDEDDRRDSYLSESEDSRGRYLGLNFADLPPLSDFDLMTIRETELFPPIARPEMFESPTEPGSPPRRARFHSMCAEIESSRSRVLFSVDPDNTEDSDEHGTCHRKPSFGFHSNSRRCSASTRFGSHHHHVNFQHHRSHCPMDHTSVASTPSACAAAAIRRRISMKEMRKCTSLPPSTSHLLSILMESRVRVPTCQSPDVAAKRRLKKWSQTQCFLELVRDISTELSVETLCSRVSINVGVLADSEPATLLLADTRTMTAASSGALPGCGVNQPVLRPFDLEPSSTETFESPPPSATGATKFLIPAPHEGLTIGAMMAPGGAIGAAVFGEKERVSSQFDMSSRSKYAIPWGKGILGKVAETGEKVVFNASIKQLERSNSKKKPRPKMEETESQPSPSRRLFAGRTVPESPAKRVSAVHPSTDRDDNANGHPFSRLASKEVCVAVLPIRNPWGEVIAVAQTVKRDGGFHPEDLQLVETYLQFVGIALTNALVLEASKKEYERNKELLEVVHDVFEVQTSVDQLVTRMMQRAHRLLHCTRAAVFLLDESSQNDSSSGVDFSKVFHSKSKRPRTWTRDPPLPELKPDDGSNQSPQECDPAAEELRCFAEQVAISGQVLNVSKTHQQLQLLQQQEEEQQALEQDESIGAKDSLVDGDDGMKGICRTPSVASSVGEMLFLAGESAKKNTRPVRPKVLDRSLLPKQKSQKASCLPGGLAGIGEASPSAGTPDCLVSPTGEEPGSPTTSTSTVTPLLPEEVSCLMAMPIRNARVEVIGVAVICNKVGDDCFDESDERWFEAFCIFSGLGLNNAYMYMQVTRAMARQTVAFEALAYHATSSFRDVEIFMARAIPRIKDWNLDAVDFDDFSLNADEMVLAAIAMCEDMGLMHRFCIDRTILYRWLLTVRRNYRDIPYHNWRHAFNVAQNMYAMLQNSVLKDCFSHEEILALFIACLCHDLDHRGTNNAFQAKSGSALAASYGTEHTMEHHHFNHAILILSSTDHNVLAHFSGESYSRIVSLIKHCILATDLTVYFKHRSEFQELATEVRDRRDMSTSQAVEYLREGDRRSLLQAQLMTACDLAACTKQWDIQRRVAYLVTTEFFDQGDKEMSELNLEPAAPMDRRRKHEFPFLQYKWIRDVCLPLYHAFGKLDPHLMEMRNRAYENMAHWRKEAEEQHLLRSDED